MAKAARATEERQDTAQACDVLVFVNKGGAVNCLWNEWPPSPKGVVEGNSARYPVQVPHRLEPGLSFVPAAKWANVQASTSWAEGTRRNEIKAVAGQRGDLEGEWARIRANGIGGMLDRTHEVKALMRLQEIESEADDPRLEVSEQLEVRLEELKVAVQRHQNKRRTTRHRTRQRMPL